MGLDMYLSKRTYVKNWDFMKPEQHHKVSVKKGGKISADIKPERITHIIEEVGYWRKFNALLNWFVENVQDGEDDCKEYYVDVSDLQKALEVLKEVSANRNVHEPNTPSAAEKLLPTTPGFFFGGTDYDDYYYEEVDRTIELFEALVKEGGDFYYQSSW
jgi:hypothetical protein